MLPPDERQKRHDRFTTMNAPQGRPTSNMTAGPGVPDLPVAEVGGGGYGAEPGPGATCGLPAPTFSKPTQGCAFGRRQGS
jgi:hypothetical protein